MTGLEVQSEHAVDMSQANRTVIAVYTFGCTGATVCIMHVLVDGHRIKLSSAIFSFVFRY